MLEPKGEETDEDHAKRRFLEEWIAAVNDDGRFGRWRSAVVRQVGAIHDLPGPDPT